MMTRSAGRRAGTVWVVPRRRSRHDLEGDAMMNRLCLMLALGASLLLAACADQPATPGPQSASLDPVAANAPYALGAGDQIDVVVFGEDNLSGVYDLDEAGAFSLPLAGRVTVNGKTTRQAEAAITARLADGLVTDPKVSVNIKRYRPIYVVGEVQRPGGYPVFGPTSVINAVALAGGYTYRARNSEITVIRYGDAAHQPVLVGESDSVQPGDTITVPERWF
jgi:polysaccharide export outer membrane protein